MNTNNLKRFAQAARRKLLEQVTAKMEMVLSTDSAELREKTEHLRKLREAINTSSKAQVANKVAYTWFNRLMALRFMDANDYQPIGMRVVTPKDGDTLPEILAEAKQGNISDELHLNKQKIYDLLDGKIPSSNPQNESYKELLIGACNHLNKVFPFLFERINDYTELLLPNDLISEFSIVHDIREGMPQEDCLEVEIIGWLYQFYISEKKDEVFASKKAVKKEDIPAATQLFTPRWIVEYMVQNTVGKLWLQNRPNSKLREHMPYFIESASLKSAEYLKVNSVEEITLLDQACGSGHILVYGFELFAKIYEEEGYNPNEIPQLIIEKNLFGFEIDKRASQLAGMALMMKARNYQRRVFSKAIVPNILCFEDLKLTKEEFETALKQIGVGITDELNHDLKTMQQATNFGSLITPHTQQSELKKVLEKIELKFDTTDAFLAYQLHELKKVLEQLVSLTCKHHCVVDNPPYMGGGNMNKELGDFVKSNYPDSKADLMACFMEVGLNALFHNGYLGMINQHSWMFLSSYEKLRKKLIKTVYIDTLLHLGPRTFPEIGGEVVQNASFSIIKSNNVVKGSFIRLVDYDSSALKREKTIDAIKNPDCGWFYKANQKDFEKIPGNPIGYWLSKNWIKIFEKSNVGSKAISDGQNITGNNDRYIRQFWEISKNEISKNGKWPLMAKGGDFRRWSGNVNFVIIWNDKAKQEYKSNQIARIQNERLWFRNGITWNLVTSGGTGFRYLENNQLFNKAAPTLLFDNDDEKYLKTLLGFLNTKITTEILKILNPTLNTNIKELLILPFSFEITSGINFIVDNCLELSNADWNKLEISDLFVNHEFIRIKGQDLEEAYDLYTQYWKNKFFQLHKNEEELNRQFIEIYGLQEELTPDVPLRDITILKEETSIENGQLVFHADEVFAQFISYAVGCMFGRYSLDKEGLILANQGETLDDYLTKIELSRNQMSFLPDDDNIIPVLDDEWFEDDIVGLFRKFVEVSFGKENLEKNMAFVKDCIGMDLRKYFVKNFYADHIKRYKKRPIYWMFSSPKGTFNVLIYMHRYTPDTLNRILKYLRDFKEKLGVRIETLEHIKETGTSSEQLNADKEKDKLNRIILELQEYERDTLYPLATERIHIDLDDGVLVNYNKFGKAIKEVAGLNDKKTKDKVKGFDWINTEEIR